MTAKEIWYVWDGKSPIPNSSKVKLLLDRKGRFSEPKFTIVLKHKGWGALDEIVAYTLGETRERVPCGVCFGQGKFYVQHRHGGDIEDCDNCQGSGYIWKMGVKS